VIEASGGAALFRILGAVEVWTSEGWAKIGAAKQRSVLATLLLRPGEPVSADVLIDEVWPGKPPARASNLVSVYMYHLRRQIGDPDGRVLVTRAPGYQVVLGPGALDADRFSGLVADGRQALADGEPDRAAGLLTEALGLWRGPALADVPATPLVAAEADRLAESRVEALELRAEANLACGRHAEVVPEVRRLLADHALREKLWALLMRALYGSGRQAEALEAYEQARNKIADELGVDPGAELRQLYHQILNADGEQALISVAQADRGPPPAPVPAQLPADIPDFTGRSEQVEQLRELLAGAAGEDSPGAVQVVLVVGSGGLGKTALAVHAAHLLASRFPDGQLYVNLLGATQPADSAEVLARFLRDLGMDGSRIPLDEEERATRYRTRLAGKRVLIVLDDARDAAQVTLLLPGSASCAVLVTTRNWLPELAGAAVLDLDVLSPGEGRALFTRVVGERRVAAEPAATDAVLAACVGLPLAIRIAGARLATRGAWSVRTLADRLSDERRRLDELQAGNLAVRASFEVSFASLARQATVDGPGPAGAFRLLGLWTGPWIRLPAASALLGEPETATAAALDALVDVHLLESPRPDRYRFHDLLRVYAADRARTQEPEERRSGAVIRLLAWYLHATEAAAAVISPQHTRVPLEPPPDGVRPVGFAALEEAIAWCDTERAGLLAATRLAASSSLHEIAWKLPAAAMSFYYRRSHWGDWVTTHLIGLDSARALGDRYAEAWMLSNLAMAYGVQRRAEAVEYSEQAMAIYRELGDLRGESRAATNVANGYLELGRFGEALEAAQRSLAIHRQAGSRYGEGIALELIGCASRELGRHAEAIEHMYAALAIFQELGDRRTEADVLSDLGEAFLRCDRVTDAAAALNDSLAIWADIDDRSGMATALERLALAQRRLGLSDQAQASLAEAVRLFGELGDEGRAAEARRRFLSSLCMITRLVAIMQAVVLFSVMTVWPSHDR
jgi:DNA-binding SARP family transcriptional activator